MRVAGSSRARRRANVGQVPKGSQTSFGATCKRSQEAFAPAERLSQEREKRKREREEEDRNARRKHERASELVKDRERRRRKEKGQVIKGEGEQSGSRRSVIYHAPRAVRRSYPPVSSLPRCGASLTPSLSSSAASSLYRLHRRATLIPLSIAGARRAYIPRRSGRPRAHCDDQEGLVTSVLVCPPFLNPRATSRRVLSTFFFYFVLSVYYSLSLSYSLSPLFSLFSFWLALARSLRRPFFFLV